MKKVAPVFIGLFASLLATGCIRTDVDKPHVSNDGAIHLDVTTTRASVSTVTDMNSGFRVFAASGRSWYPGIDGTNNHVYSNGQWHFQTPVPWPTDEAKYPLMFYAWYPVDSADHGPTITVNNPASIPIKLQGSFTVQPKAADQVDFLVSKSVAVERPVGGNLVMTFKHALSKIDFGIIPGREVTTEILALGIMNVGDTRTYDFVAGNWTSAQPDLSTSIVYDYYGNFLDTNFGGATFSSAPWSPGVGNDEVTSVPFFTASTTPSAADAHLMLMPQTSLAWDPVAAPVLYAGNGASVVMIYRMTTHGGVDEVGFASARSHPDFVEGDYEGPLYVLAGFPLPADASGNFTWAPGKGYVYNIGLGTSGSSNGYVQSAGYFDENGQGTGFRLIGGLDPGDPLNDGVIHIDLDVDDWGDDDGGELPPVSGTDVQVGNIIWSGTNVAAPGVFSSTAQLYGTHLYTFDEATSSAVSTGSLDGSVCPAGWRMPTVTDFYNLVQANITPFPVAGDGVPDAYYNDTYYYNANVSGRGWDDTGYVSGETLIVPNGTLFFSASGRNGAEVGTHGAYWSSVEYDVTYAYRMDYNSSLIGPSGWTDKTWTLSVRCVKPVSPDPIFVAPEAPYIIYWDDATQTMQAGSWNAVQGGAVKTENQLFFQMGSTVAILNDVAVNGAPFDASKIKFDVTGTQAAYAGIPNWGNYTGDKTSTAEGYLSSADYHNAANVATGRGDPCKLVGLTVDQVKAGYIDNGRFRMATAVDQWTAGWSVYGTPPAGAVANTTFGEMSAAGTFLPASGSLDGNGSPGYLSGTGFLWTSTPSGPLSGWYSWWNDSGTSTDSDGNPISGHLVRCIDRTILYPVSATLNYDAVPNAGGTVKITSDVAGMIPITEAVEGQSVTFTLVPADPATTTFGAWYLGNNYVRLNTNDTHLNPITITMPGSRVIVDGYLGTFEPSGGVTIPNDANGVNGIIWASEDLINNGAFDGLRQFAGAFFQWGRDVPYENQGYYDGMYGPSPTMNPTPGYPQTPGSDQTGAATWPEATDPCPNDWRLPTSGEWQRFLDATTDPLSGSTRPFHLTDDTNSDYILFNANGYITDQGLGISYYDSNGNNNPLFGAYFWAGDSNSGDNTRASYFYWTGDTNPAALADDALKTNAYKVRCVRDYVENVAIGSYTWSTRNIDTYGKFTTEEWDYGRLYQFGSAAMPEGAKVAWPGMADPTDVSASNPGIQWSDGSDVAAFYFVSWSNAWSNTGDWAAANNPCPAGYSVPTWAQWQDLLDNTTDPVGNETVNGVLGHRLTSIADPTVSLFLPAGGLRSDSPGILTNPSAGLYWSTTDHAILTSPYSYALRFTSTTAAAQDYYGTTTALSIRCVRTL